MTTIYLIRHAQAQGNVDRVFQGHYDGKITDFGIKQLECLSEAFKDIKLDAIYTSPLSRAYTTAEYANKYHNLEIKINDDLIEINGGDWEGRKWTEFPISDPEQSDNWYNNPYEFCAPNGERMKDAYERIKNAILQIVKENKDKTICIISHGGVISCAINWLMGKEPSSLTKETICDNTAINKAVFDDELNPKLVDFNKTEHLGDNLHVSVTRMWVK